MKDEILENKKWEEYQRLPTAEKLKMKLSGLRIHKEQTDKAQKYREGAKAHGTEVKQALDLFRETKDKSFLKSVRFHTDLMKQNLAEADKHDVAAQEVVDRFDLATIVKQAGLKHVKKPSPSFTPKRGKKSRRTVYVSRKRKRRQSLAVKG